MRIEQKARSLIREAIELDKELKSIEIREKIKGTILMMSEDYIELKRKVRY